MGRDIGDDDHIELNKYLGFSENLGRRFDG